MAVFPNRIGQPARWVIDRRRARDVEMRTLSVSPAVIAAGTTGWFVVDLFPCALAHVCDDQGAVSAARWPVELVAPGIAQPETPDLFLHARGAATHERVRRRDHVAGRVVRGHVHVDAQHLAEQLRGILCAVLRIIARATITESDVKIAIWTEHQIAGVVIRVRLRNVFEPRWPLQIEPR